METRRFILALSLSLLVFLAYVKFFAPPPPQKPAAEPEAAQQEALLKKEAGTANKPARLDIVAAKIVQAAGGKISLWRPTWCGCG